MTFKEIEKILGDYGFYGLTVHRCSDGNKLSYTFESISYYTVSITVDVLRLNEERLVSKVKVGNVTIDDEKELIPTLNGVYKIHNKILYGKRT